MERMHAFGITPWHRDDITDEIIRGCEGRLFKIKKMPDVVSLDEVPFRGYVERHLKAMYFSKHFAPQPLPDYVRTDYVVKVLMQYYCKFYPVRPKKAISHLLKRKVWARHVGEDKGSTKCFCCNMTTITMLTFNCGHIVAEVRGGPTTVENLLPICQHCNSSMGTQDMREFMKNNM